MVRRDAPYGFMTTLSSRFQEALAFAAELHAAQRRKLSGVPYLGHLLRVAGIVLEYGGTEDEAVAALLHDAIEDQGGESAREEIRRRFGPDVLAVVEGCSDTDQSPKPPWRERKEAYLKHLQDASPAVRLVTAADKLDNIRSLTASYRQDGESIWRHFGGGREGTLWYYRGAIERLKTRGQCPLVEELERAMAEFSALMQKKTADSDRELRFFIAGIMQGSHSKRTMHDQNYRVRLKALLLEHFPNAQVYDPRADHSASIDYDDRTGRSVFFGHNQMCREIDVLVAFLPEASMGTAIEMWEAHTHGAVVIAISPLAVNWAVRFLSHIIFADEIGFEAALVSGELEREIGKIRSRDLELKHGGLPSPPAL